MESQELFDHRTKAGKGSCAGDPAPPAQSDGKALHTSTAAASRAAGA